jgi:hypothetical protein
MRVKNMEKNQMKREKREKIGIRINKMSGEIRNGF